MAVNLKHPKPTTVEQVNENIEEISQVLISKAVTNIDTSTISSPFTDPDTEAIRKVLLNLINNLKGS